MKTNLIILLAVAFCAAISPAQIGRAHTSTDYVSIPSSGTGGQSGGASNPANLAHITANFTDSIIVSHVTSYFHLVHGRVGDLTMTLSHCGTSITLFSGSLNQAASANGDFTFDDAAPTTFASAVNAAQGLVPTGHYQPAQSMSAFNGQNSTGPWVLTIADLATGVSGTGGWMQIYVTSGAQFDFSTFPYIPIPDGSGGVCTSPLTHTVNVPASGQVGLVSATVGLNHTYSSDLTITLSHAGVTVTLIEANNPNAPANLSGFYSFEDAAGTTWAQAVTGLPTTATVPPGWHRPLTPLAAFQGLDQAGQWTLSICDEYALDTGEFYGMGVAIGPAAWDLQIQQPNGTSSITLANSGGRMGDSYANMITLAPGAFPYGWLHGVDITMQDVLAEVSFGAPFFGPLGACGSASTTVSGPIPSGLTLYVTSIEVDASISVINFKPGFTYTTL